MDEIRNTSMEKQMFELTTVPLGETVDGFREVYG